MAENSADGSSIVGKVKEQAAAQLSSQKERATDSLGSVAQAVRQTTQHLRDNQHETVARYAEQTAEQIERFSQRLKDKDIGELLNDAQRLARRQPALFIGGAFALGLIGARFLKSSSPEGESSYGNYGGSNDGGSGRAVSYGNPNFGAGSYGNAGYGGTIASSPSGVGGSTGSTPSTGTSPAGTASDTLRGSDSRTETGGGPAGNAYGNRVPTSSRKASGTSNKKTDSPPTEGL